MPVDDRTVVDEPRGPEGFVSLLHPVANSTVQAAPKRYRTPEDRANRRFIIASYQRDEPEESGFYPLCLPGRRIFGVPPTTPCADIGGGSVARRPIVGRAFTRSVPVRGPGCRRPASAKEMNRHRAERFRQLHSTCVFANESVRSVDGEERRERFGDADGARVHRLVEQESDVGGNVDAPQGDLRMA